MKRTDRRVRDTHTHITQLYFCHPDDGTHKDGVENSRKLKLVLVCPTEERGTDLDLAAKQRR